MSTLAEVLRPRFARGFAGTVVPARLGSQLYDVAFVFAGSVLIEVAKTVLAAGALPVAWTLVPRSRGR